MSEETNASAATSSSSNLDVLLLAVSMAAPSNRSSSNCISEASNNFVNTSRTAVAPPPPISAASFAPPLVTPPTTIEILEGQAANTMPILTPQQQQCQSGAVVPGLMMRTPHPQYGRLFTSTSSITSSLPAPKIQMRNDDYRSSMFVTRQNSLPIKKRFANREGGGLPLPPPAYGTFAGPVPSGAARVPSDRDTTTNVVATTTMTTQPTAPTPPPVDNTSSTTTSTSTTTQKKAKKEKKKYRKPTCSHPSCPNRVMNRGVCARHGARVRICRIPECSKYAQKGGVCIRHGAKKEYRRCCVEGCNARAAAVGSGSGSNGGGSVGSGGRSVCSRHAGSYCLVVSAPVGDNESSAREARQDVDNGRTIPSYQELQQHQLRESM